jgi:hypothetical protein
VDLCAGSSYNPWDTGARPSAGGGGGAAAAAARPPRKTEQPAFLAVDDLHGLEWAYSTRTRILVCLWVILNMTPGTWRASFKAAGVAPFNRPKKLAAAIKMEAMKRGDDESVKPWTRRTELADCYDEVMAITNNAALGVSEKLLEIYKAIAVVSGKGMLVKRELKDLKPGKKAKIKEGSSSSSSSSEGEKLKPAKGKGKLAKPVLLSDGQDTGIFEAETLQQHGVALQEYEKKVAAAKPFVCQACNRKYKYAAGLANHIADKHQQPGMSMLVEGTQQAAVVPSDDEVQAAIVEALKTLKSKAKVLANVKELHPNWIVSAAHYVRMYDKVQESKTAAADTAAASAAPANPQ